MDKNLSKSVKILVSKLMVVGRVGMVATNNM